jgi:hypothetical protein
MSEDLKMKRLLAQMKSEIDLMGKMLETIDVDQHYYSEYRFRVALEKLVEATNAIEEMKEN